jgi:hypothetical protein
MPLLALLTFTFAALVAGLAVGVLLNRQAFERRKDARAAELFAQIETLPTYYSEADVAELPEPVRRYFARNLNEGMPHQSCVRLRESGKMRQKPGQPWTEFVAEEYLVANPPGLVWFARSRPFPLVWIDSLRVYLRGRAHASTKLLSSVSSVDRQDQATRQATLLRYVAALPLFPGALLPGEDRAWVAHGDDSARFVLRDDDLEVAGVFFFDEFGNVVRFETDERPLEDARPPAAARWVVRYGEHRAYGSSEDLQLPTKVDIEWETDGKTFHYMDTAIDEFELDVPHAWSAVTNREANTES